MKVKNYVFFALLLSCLSMLTSFSLASHYEPTDHLLKAMHHARKSHHPSLKKAIQILEQTEKGNSKDLQHLFHLAAKGVRAQRRHGPEHYQQFLQRVCLRLMEDQQRLQQWQQRWLQLPQQSEDRVILSTAIDKLLGFENASGQFFTGILADSIELLQSQSIDFHSHKINGVEPKNNQVTVLKTALLYVNLELAQKKTLQEMPEITQHLQLLYPAAVPAVPEDASLSQMALMGKDNQGQGILWVPNAGYVFGGRIYHTSKKHPITHGVDCSSLLFWATHHANATVQGQAPPCSTKGAAMAWCVLKNQRWEEDRELSVEQLRQKLLASPDGFILDHYVAVEASEVQDGDLVIWRHFDPQQQKGSGHTALFAGWLDGSRGQFIGIEATRTDDKSSEGVAFHAFTLSRELCKTYVLRAHP